MTSYEVIEGEKMGSLHKVPSQQIKGQHRDIVTRYSQFEPEKIVRDEC